MLLSFPARVQLGQSQGSQGCAGNCTPRPVFIPGLWALLGGCDKPEGTQLCCGLCTWHQKCRGEETAGSRRPEMTCCASKAPGPLPMKTPCLPGHKAFFSTDPSFSLPSAEGRGERRERSCCSQVQDLGSKAAGCSHCRAIASPCVTPQTTPLLLSKITHKLPTSSFFPAPLFPQAILTFQRQCTVSRKTLLSLPGRFP